MRPTVANTGRFEQPTTDVKCRLIVVDTNTLLKFVNLCRHHSLLRGQINKDLPLIPCMYYIDHDAHSATHFLHDYLKIVLWHHTLYV